MHYTAYLAEIKTLTERGLYIRVERLQITNKLAIVFSVLFSIVVLLSSGGLLMAYHDVMTYWRLPYSRSVEIA